MERRHRKDIKDMERGHREREDIEKVHRDRTYREDIAKGLWERTFWRGIYGNISVLCTSILSSFWGRVDSRHWESGGEDIRLSYIWNWRLVCDIFWRVYSDSVERCERWSSVETVDRFISRVWKNRKGEKWIEVKVSIDDIKWMSNNTLDCRWWRFACKIMKMIKEKCSKLIQSCLWSKKTTDINMNRIMRIKWLVWDRNKKVK